MIKKQTKKGFTIVELVIVIAIIAILAAVLIPTFSNVIKKANLSADKQAVREMNMALAADEAQNGYGRNVNVEDAMEVLGHAGYNTDNWTCLTDGYQVYWYDEDNRCILYNSATAEIEYPEEYIGAKTKDGTQLIMLSDHVHIYNENHIKAQQFNMSLSSSAKVGSDGKISGTTTFTDTTALKSTTTKNGVSISGGKSATNLSKLSGTEVKKTISKALTGQENSPVYMYATKEDVSAETSGAYASLQICSVGTEEKLVNNGEVKENLYYLSVETQNGTAEQISSAQKAAAQYVYNIFDQITAGKINDNVTVIVENGTTIDCSLGGADWAPCKTFTGYFGCPGEGNTITINGANLTTKTGYAQTVRFDGSSSKYFVTGFFGTVYGDTTIENVVFENINIDQPASDYKVTQDDKEKKLTNSRNTVGIIGGITDGWDGTAYHSGDVTISNVVVKNTCTLVGQGCGGGLVGYVGSSNSAGSGKADPIKVTIDNCKVACKVSSVDTIGTGTGYGTIGGIVGFGCRSDSFKLYIKDCEFNGTVESYGGAAGIIGSNQGLTVYLQGTNDVSKATFIGHKNAKDTDASLAAVSTGSVGANVYINEGTVRYKNGMAAFTGTAGTFFTNGLVPVD